MIKRTRCTLPEIPQTELSVSHLTIPGKSPLNHDELHIHRECEIYINLSGDVSFEVESRIYPIDCGSVIITKPYEYHHCICHSDTPHEHYWVTFTAQESAPFLQIFFDRKKGTGNLITLDSQTLRRVCVLLEHIQEQESPLSQHISFMQVLDLLGRNSASKTPASLLPADVDAALTWMDEHLSEEISVHQLAKAGSVSVNTLERHFRLSLGISPMAQLKKKRLLISMALLREGASVSKAAQACGFFDDSGYIRFFRQSLGMTPLQYKKLFRGQKESGRSL